MEITGKIIKALEVKKGTSQRTGNEWSSQSYVLETQEQYPRKICFDVFGSDKIQQFAIQEGETLTVSFDIDAREYQGRWFNSIRAWKVDRNVAAQPSQQPTVAPAPPFNSAAAPATPPAPADLGGGDNTDDLPF